MAAVSSVETVARRTEWRSLTLREIRRVCGAAKSNEIIAQALGPGHVVRVEEVEIRSRKAVDIVDRSRRSWNDSAKDGRFVSGQSSDDHVLRRIADPNAVRRRTRRFDQSGHP